MGEYSEAELEAALRRAFVVNRADTIIYDGHVACRQPFLRAGFELGIRKGWLVKTGRVDESQYTAAYYGLSDEGRKHFGIN